MKHPPDRHQKSLQIGLQKDWLSVFNEYGENNFSLYQNAKKSSKYVFLLDRNCNINAKQVKFLDSPP